ncbi:D-glycero-beta-D-manno-heptose 1,7-bisphosphate 7-phosphatase [Saliniradius amylolyticus]|uniref:D,D-heptose 1,7-bisphosphate phosphatase n=1 Tax=Saliniradius amylolyticus TaxID=2183582 RepID=A0A2S2E349_9ALTE|nr:D-glycero-beta-D-manno-heptose 1,7-bisphosphate 7-phosphatase [Saliniradius amylolyticus]AWL12071.1 D-glycero-beta-D-manno-heptose 1,7-bisphosphate 7-phosphatase [Saliniradius amylolyticus]
MKALLLDRDGIINVDHGYVSRSEDFEFVPGIFDLCRAYAKRGFLVVVVTNQSGIGRGYYDEAAFWQLTDWMKAQFREQGVEIAGVYFCPHHPQKAQGAYLQHCECRKPAPGMLLQAARELNLELRQSVMVGDKPSDMEAAAKAGVGTGYLVGADELPTMHPADSLVAESLAGVPRPA